ncbi:MAG: hypothetical protein WCW13_06125 [archaeon]|jgi:hypothetical protein
MFDLKKENIFGFKNKELNQIFEFSLYAIALVLIPALISQQIIVGALVNALLISAALNHSIKRIFVLAVLPSLTVFGVGVIFGGLTSSLILMLPFIWAGNILICLITKRLVNNKVNYFLSTLIGSITKTIILFFCALVLFEVSLVPTVFLTAFGVIQFFTAEIGAIIVWVVRRLKTAVYVRV